MNSLFDPIKIGDIALANRIVMAPLTRNRAIEGHKPGPLTVEYYRQRATAGLIIAEASQISPMAQGYLDTPGIYSTEQVAAWREVTDAVHAEGGRIVLQLWHVGRISHTSLLPDGAAPVSSTSRRPEAMTFTRDGFVPVSEPRALRDDELPALIEDYRRAARNAIAAGFDGVEIHAANTYLIEQFLRDSINDRSGPYGGSIANRARLLLEVVQAVTEEIGAGRTGVRLSPMTTFGNTAPLDSDPQALHNYVVEQLAPFGLAFLHVIEGETGGTRSPEGKTFDYEALHRRFPGAWLVNNGYSLELAKQTIEDGKADLIAFGRPFISNPDLVRRLREAAPLNDLRADKLYGGGAEGYTDYPFLPA
ncbi:alkene reductase [Ferribacterium limneticum]|uniref:alkene reductase n=1 Tax=Ferribacterium limneticum TaxID=76259 RepID=UPI001CF9C8FC|nr:alkene reductase [Ferribacterium limneticum]UCV30266.1 alkene reductase [Ferribacterium limneticum]UCV34185.1 alkene reductase [Ferribacterium limneticum]